MERPPQHYRGVRPAAARSLCVFFVWHRYPLLFSHGFDVQLLHDLGAVLFDGLGAEAEIGRNALAGFAVDDALQYLMFAFGQLRHTFARLVEFGHSAAAFPVALQRVLNAVKQRLIVERLFDEIDVAAFERPHRHRYVAVAGDDDDGHLHMAGRKVFLQLQAAHVWHAHVEHDAAGGVVAESGEKLLCRFIGFDGKTDGLDQPAQGLAHRLIVVDHVGDRLRARRHKFDLARGRVNVSFIPWGYTRSAHNRPPWLSIIVRLIDNPIPIPLDLVV